MFKQSARSAVRVAGLASALVISAAIGGCGGGGDKETGSLDTPNKLLSVGVQSVRPPTWGDTPLPEAPGPQSPCTNDSEFFPADGTSNSNGLKNRHVLCVKQQTTNYVDVFDNENVLYHNSGIMTLDAMWSVHGSHKVLEKGATLKLRYAYSPLNHLPAPTMNIRGKIWCENQDDSASINCDTEIPTITLANGGEHTQNLTIPLSNIAWQVPLRKIASVTVHVAFYYTTDGTAPEPFRGGSTNSIEPKFGYWTLRCDEDQIQKGFKGCVFKDAAAVWVMPPRGDIQQARQHIIDSFAALYDVPGQFQLAPGTRSEALVDVTHTPLTRGNNEIGDINRAAARKRCDELFSPAPPAIPEPTPYCSAPERCACDEYPPAASLEGAASGGKFSVRKILTDDNSQSGTLMNSFFTTERVLENDKFWIAP